MDARKLLLVEDQAIIAMSQKLDLERYGYSVDTCSSGERAVALMAEDSTIDLVLMDINLGSGMDGTEAARRILAERDLPLVFLSSHTEQEIVRRTEGITSYGYVVKNSGITVLDAAIRMAFRLHTALHEVQMLTEELQSSLDDVLTREAALRESEAKLEGWNRLLDYIISHDNSAVAVLDRDLVFLYVSNRFHTEYRLAPDEVVVGRHHYDVFPDIPQKWRQVHQRALAGEVLRSDCDTFTRADGSTDYTRWEVRPWYEHDGTIGGIILYSEVITGQMTQRFQLEESEARFRLLVELVPSAVIISTDQERIIFASKRFDTLFGYRQEILDRPEQWWPRAYPDPVLRAQAQAEWAQLMAQARATGQPSRPVVYPVTRADGSIIHVEFRLAATGNLNVITYTDVSDQIRSEEQIRSLLEEQGSAPSSGSPPGQE